MKLSGEKERVYEGGKMMESRIQRMLERES
jgi:hypothetical protein